MVGRETEKEGGVEMISLATNCLLLYYRASPSNTLTSTQDLVMFCRNLLAPKLPPSN